MLNSFWNWFVIIITIVTLVGCFWLLQWTKGISDRDDDGSVGTTGHVWDEDLVELNNPLPKWWLKLFYITIIFTGVYFVLFGGLGNVGGVLNWSQESQYEAEMLAADAAQEDVFAYYRQLDNEALIANAEANATGQRLFANHCRMCHGSDGRGGKGFPNLADDVWQYGGDFDAVTQSISAGRNGVMPVMVAGLDDAGVDDLVAYVQSLSGQAVDETQAARGKSHFDTLCVACHGPDGGGNQALGALRLNDDTWLYGGDADTIRTTLTQGRNGNMPAHQELLGDDRVRLLAAYVLSLGE